MSIVCLPAGPPFRILMLLLFFLSKFAVAQVTVKEEERMIKTYPFSDPNPVPVLTSNTALYPYHVFDGYSQTAQEQPWKVVTLENKYIRVSLLPQVGGRVWGAIEKSTGEEFIYQNEVLKFRNIAMRGPWTSGGIEFNFGIIGHSPATATPVDYMIQKHDDGSVSCVVGMIDLPSRTQWRVRVTLSPDKAYFETDALWYNPTPTQQAYYNWMTAAAEVRPDLEFFYPGYLSLEHSGEAVPWPIDSSGRQLNWYKNNNFGTNKSYHVVGAYHNFFGGYWHDTQVGFGHWSHHDDMLGQKLWLWDQSRSGGIWEDLLTDTDGQYMEFQAGRLFNQFSPGAHENPISKVAFAPQTSDRWRELWFPFKSIGGLTNVSPTAAMNVVEAKGSVTIGINALSSLEDTLVVVADEQLLYRKPISLAPMDTLATTVAVPATTKSVRVEVKGADLRYTTQEHNQRLQRPFAEKASLELSVADQHYRAGVAAARQRQYEVAIEQLEASIEEYPAHYRARVALAELLYQQGNYEAALEQVRLALIADTYDYDANYVAGIIYNAQGAQTDALESFGIAARTPAHRAASYVQMAEIEVQQKDYALAEDYAKRALDYDQYNVGAYQVLAVAFRQRSMLSEAQAAVANLLDIDPLCHFARFERYLLEKTETRRNEFTSLIRHELPYQTYLEIAMDYQKMQQPEAAVAVLQTGPDHPLINLWLAYLTRKQPTVSQPYLQKVVAQSPAFVFPFRRETLAALTWAQKQQKHWKLDYYRGLVYWAVGRTEDAAAQFTACGDTPDDAPFYLARAVLLEQVNDQDEASDIHRALALDKNQWRAWHQLLDYYNRHDLHDKEQATAQQAYQRFPDSYVIGMDYAQALFHRNQYKEAAQLLKSLHILPYEGASEGRTVFEQVYLRWAMQQMQQQQYASAVKLLKTSLDWPENLGVGKPYDPDTRPQNYLLAYCYQQLGKATLAQQHLQQVIDFTQQQAERSPYDLLAVLVLRQQGKADKAIRLQEAMKREANTPLMSWAVAYATDQNEEVPLKETKHSDAFESLKQLLHTTKRLNKGR